MSLSRRYFLKQASAATIGFTALQSVLMSGRVLGPVSGNRFGPLQEDPQGVLDLPQGFSYKIISQAGDSMTDGFVVPSKPDGMAAFPGPDGLTLLMRNHEVEASAQPEEGPFGAGNRLRAQLEDRVIYDQGWKETGPMLGGVTTVTYDTAAQEVKQEHLSLAGTVRNCAGGPTPWNSWITCEETNLRKGDTCARNHGYNFEVPAALKSGLVTPIPLADMGRFRHEAVAVDPGSGVVYQTEDRHEGLIYRFLPRTPGRLEQGGRLQALSVIGRPSLDTRNWGDGPALPPGTKLQVEWIDVDGIESPQDDLRFRGFEDGAARFARSEGMWYGRKSVYFACTNGGPERKGQIWCYRPSSQEGTPAEKSEPASLELFVQPSDGSLIENADNITVAPWGDIIACEDGSGDQYLRGITPKGNIYEFARNAVSHSEFAGATFSPDGTTLFVNIQHSGLTLAIVGPWEQA